MKVRFLIPSDVVAYRDLRLAAMQECPTAFGSDYQGEAQLTLDQLVPRIRSEHDPLCGLLGSFTDDGELTGMLGFNRERGPKRQHVAMLTSAYVAKSFRRRGIGGHLLDSAISHARTIGTRQLVLSVTSNNGPARNLYLSRGFTRFGFQHEVLYVDGKYYDMEFMNLHLQMGT